MFGADRSLRVKTKTNRIEASDKKRDRAQHSDPANVSMSESSNAEQLFHAICELIPAAMERHKVPGVALGITCDGREFIRGFGVTNAVPRGVRTVLQDGFSVADRRYQWHPAGVSWRRHLRTDFFLRDDTAEKLRT